MRKRIAVSLLVVGALVALAALSEADVVKRTSGTGTVAVAPSSSPAVANPASPASPAQPVRPVEPSDSFDPTQNLQQQLGALDVQGLTADERRDLRSDIKDGFADISDAIDERDADLDEQSDALHAIDHDKGVKGSDELKAAQDRLATLTDELHGFKSRLIDIHFRVDAAIRDDHVTADALKTLIADIRAFGSGLDAMGPKIDELDTLVSAAESRSQDDRRN